ncbi:hypothetical protein [uncultured Mobiluncus sp.]|uniref:phage holin n=1 Tax=uncultured Mobiluncus sp. TaxID=293425 RepID=UPI00260F4FB4|nr:hypothetical protein [uncultured Mobiluncus sp.]
MENKEIIPARIRTWLYGIITAAIPLLSAYGVISEQMAPLWVALGAALLGSSTAFAYRPTRTPKEVE